jgi:PQQ-dependent catabolism-associated beta-propeller protein
MNKIKITIYSLITIYFTLAINIANSKYIFVSNENSDTVTVLDSNTKKIIKTIKTGGRPRDMKLNANNTKLYLVVSEENHIAVIDTNKLKIIEYIECGDDPEIFDISPNGNFLAVSNEDDNQLTIINAKNNKIVTTIKNVGVEPEGVNFSPDGKSIYITSEGTNSIIIVDFKSKQIVDEILVGNRPRRGMFLKNGNEYWVSNELSGSVTVINTSTLKIKKTINFSVKGIRDQNITPVDFAYSTNLKKIFVTLGSANHVAIVNSESYIVEKYILSGSRTWGAALTIDEKELIVTNGNSDDISIIDLKKQVTKNSIPVGKTPHTVRIMN